MNGPIDGIVAQRKAQVGQTVQPGQTLMTVTPIAEAYVDANGRVQDYRILSDSNQSQEVLPKVKRMLIFTTFRPALSMGRPTPSRAVLSFSKVNVKG